MAQIIAVDDELAIREMLADILGIAGFIVRTANGGADLRRLMTEQVADLVLLDVTMPGEDGLTLARQLRMTSNVGIIMLTAAGETIERIVGLEIGADDYLGKPFDPRELIARIEAVLRRRRPEPATVSAVALGRLRFEPASRRLLAANGEVIQLTIMERELLAAFAMHPNQVLDRDTLLDLAPPRSDEPFDRSIDNRVTRLRAKIEPDRQKPRFLKTVHGTGYILVPSEGE